MLSYTSLRTLFGDLSNNTASATLTIADKLINIKTREITSKGNWDFLEKSATQTTTAAQQFYNLPNDCEKVISVKVTVGTTVYTPRECPDRKTWDRLNMSTVSSDYPEWFYIFDGQIGFYPIPSTTTADAITLIYKRKQRDLSVADYTTGTITTLTAAGVVTGSGTTWTASMVGRYLKVTETDVANGGDGQWYEIGSYSSATSISLALPYQGTAIAAGSATYTIGQMSILPEEFQELPVYGALEMYYTSIQPDQAKAGLYKVMWMDGLKRLMSERGNKSTNMVIDDGTYYKMHNPNLYVSL